MVTSFMDAVRHSSRWSQSSRRRCRRSTSSSRSRVGCEALEGRIYFSSQSLVDYTSHYNTYQWYYNNPAFTGGLDVMNVAKNATSAWDEAQGLSTVYVGVIDTGIDATHEDLAANVDTADGTNFWADGNNPPYIDSGDHGTEVAGIIGGVGGGNAGGTGNPRVAGIDWQVQMIPVRVSPSPPGLFKTELVAEGINYLCNLKETTGKDVVAINCSFSVDPSDPASAYTDLKNAIVRAGQDNILIAAAALNGDSNGHGFDIDTSPVYPASYASTSLYGNTYWNVIPVGATDQGNGMATFSNWGNQSVHVVAPGVHMYTTVYFPGSNYGGDGQPNDKIPQNTPYDTVDANGTSFATALVTGTIALEASAAPGATASQLKDALYRSVTSPSSLPFAQGDSSASYTDPYTSQLKLAAYGSVAGGMLNVYQAVHDAQQNVASLSHMLVLGAPSGYTGWDQVKVYNGTTRQLMYNLCVMPGVSTGIKVAAGLVTADQLPDLVVSYGTWVDLYDGVSLGRLDHFQPFNVLQNDPQASYNGPLNLAAGILPIPSYNYGVIAVAQAAGGDTRVFTYGSGNYHQYYWDQFFFSGYYSGVSVAIGSINGGGNDLVVGQENSSTPWVAVYKGDGSKALLWTFQVPYFTAGINVAAGFFDTGRTLAIGEYGAIVFFNGQTESTVWNGYTSQETSVVYLAAGDLNSDGITELVVSDLSAPSVKIWSDPQGAWCWQIWQPYGTLTGINVAAY